MSEEPAAPSRIILPGGSKPGGLVGPDGRPISSGLTEEGAPAEQAAEAAPAHPRLRPVELQEAEEGGRHFVVLIDPSGIATEALAISAEAMPILMLLDGRVALDDLVALVDQETGDPRAGDGVRKLVEQLDRHLYLEGPKVDAARAALRDAYRALPSRPAALAGVSYPADPAALTPFLAAFDDAARAMPDPPRGAHAPRALAAPHIDLRRGGATIARAYGEIAGRPAAEQPDVVFVFGTGHTLVEEPFALTAKSYDTPLGRVHTDEAIVAALAKAVGEAVTSEEIAHRDEHSIEFQAVELAHALGDRPFTIVPLLCGAFHAYVRYERRPSDDPLVESLVAALAEQVAQVEAAGRRVLFIAGVDLSHVGARFGDAIDLDAAALADIEAKDRAALAAAVTGSADAWFDAVARHGDSTRICGFAPLYMMLRVAGLKDGRLLAYEQSVEEGGSVVTYASVAWP